MKIIAIIPIKHHSSRVPGKNYKVFNGKPLYYWIINTLLQVEEINEIVIDTNSKIVKEGVQQYFLTDKIRIYDRPKHLWSGDTPTNILLKNVIQDLQLDADYFLQTHTTNPLVKPKTIKDAIFQFKNSKKESLFSVVKHQTRFYDKNGEDYNHNRYHLIPTQDLDPIYEENSCIYLFTRETLEKYNARIGKDAFLYEMSKIESQDIDWEDDFTIAEILCKLYPPIK